MKSKQELIKDINKIAEEYDFLVVDDYYTNNHWAYGSNAEYDSLKSGGGKFVIINAPEIEHNNVLFDEQYITVEELADLILEHWA